jgi:Rhs element Vgr protein
MPQPSFGLPVSLKIRSDGTEIPDTARVFAVETRAEVNRIPEAVIVFGDGDVASGEFPLSDGALLKPGAAVTIAAGYGEEVEEIFKGVVTGQRMRVLGQGEPRLEIRCHAKAFKLTIGRKSAVFLDRKDSEIVSAIAAAAGLSAETDATDYSWPEIVQHDCTDWDFLLMRAEANGLLVVVEDDGLVVRAPDLAAAAEFAVSYGEDIRRLDIEIEARGQLKAVEAAGWDEATLQRAEARAGGGDQMAWGDLAAGSLADVGGLEAFAIRSCAPLNATLLAQVARGRQLRAALARMRGRVVIDGRGSLRPGSIIEIKGVGRRFGGKPYVSGVVHRIDGGDWSTEAVLGLGDETLGERGGAGSRRAAGLQPPVGGLQIAVVAKVDEDPEGAGRIQVELPMVADQAKVWARLASPYASDAFGLRFVPEVGDEVVLGFLNDDPNAPVVLGSLFGKKHAPPVQADAENKIKTLVTRSGLRVAFDDDRKTMVLETPAGNRATLDDEAKAVKIEDQNGNLMKLSGDGIALDSARDVKISAKGKVTIDATGNVEIGPTGDLKLDGMNVQAKAQVAFSASGSAQAELKSTGQLTVKGALVMIN